MKFIWKYMFFAVLGFKTAKKSIQLGIFGYWKIGVEMDFLMVEYPFNDINLSIKFICIGYFNNMAGQSTLQLWLLTIHVL